MTWRQIILWIVVNGLLFVPITFELVSSLINELKDKKKTHMQNVKFIKEYGNKTRKLCTSCKYYVWEKLLLIGFKDAKIL